MTVEQLEHQFRMLLMNEGEDYGEEILVSLISEKSAKIAEKYANEKVKEEMEKAMNSIFDDIEEAIKYDVYSYDVKMVNQAIRKNLTE